MVEKKAGRIKFDTIVVSGLHQGSPKDYVVLCSQKQQLMITEMTRVISMSWAKTCKYPGHHVRSSDLWGRIMLAKHPVSLGAEQEVDRTDRKVHAVHQCLGSPGVYPYRALKFQVVLALPVALIHHIWLPTD
jgi:hypothetical protein